MALELTLLITCGAVALLGVVLYLYNRRVAGKTLVTGATMQGAKETLDRLADWTKWMSGIQTALLGAIGFIIKDVDSLKDAASTSVTVLLIGLSLFCSAWVLSSLPSISTRLSAFKPQQEETDGRYDVYEQPLYGFTSFRLSFMASLMHWLWAGSLISFAAFLLKLL